MHRDGQRYIRVIAAEPAYDRLVQRSFEKIKQSSLGVPAVMIRTLEALGRIMAETTSEGQRRVLLDQAAMIDRASERCGAGSRRPGRYPAALRGHLDHGREAGGGVAGGPGVQADRSGPERGGNGSVGNAVAPFVEVIGTGVTVALAE